MQQLNLSSSLISPFLSCSSTKWSDMRNCVERWLSCWCFLGYPCTPAVTLGHFKNSKKYTTLAFYVRLAFALPFSFLSSCHDWWLPCSTSDKMQSFYAIFCFFACCYLVYWWSTVLCFPRWCCCVAALPAVLHSPALIGEVNGDKPIQSFEFFVLEIAYCQWKALYCRKFQCEGKLLLQHLSLVASMLSSSRNWDHLSYHWQKYISLLSILIHENLCRFIRTVLVRNESS